MADVPGADTLTISADLRPGDREAVVDGLVAYNAAHDFPWPWRNLDLVLRDGAGAVLGGALGEINAGWCFLKALWVDERLRGRGHGRRLLAAVEAAARGRGCLGVYLDTYSFQARPFYERAGYRVFGALPDHPPGGAKLSGCGTSLGPGPVCAGGLWVGVE
ncbi:blasticidin S-acetyltransferase [Gemmatimonadetes bacterium T265]|nr:blasticidin S-acetyltransferase [Gemmatimonadetes bacterium T265]